MPELTPTPAAEDSAQIPGFNVLLMGDSGSGKTTALRTLIDCGLEVFVVFTEPGMDLLADISSDKLHWAYCPPSTTNYKDRLTEAKLISGLSWESISKKTNDPMKSKHQSYVKLLTILSDFPDARTGKNFGAVDEWDTSRVLVIDSLAGINQMSFQHVAGMSLARTQPQWGAAMGLELDLVNSLCFDTRCHFILTAHLDKVHDEIFGGMTIQVNALGNKNAPEFPKNFTDVILAVKDGNKFSWSTNRSGVVLKGRNLPNADNLPPDFKPLHIKWKERAYAHEGEK
jgi:hypothetical protein